MMEIKNKQYEEQIIDDKKYIINECGKLVEYEECDNNSYYKLRQIQGIDSNKSKTIKIKLPIKNQLGIPNRITQCRETEIECIRDIEIYFYNKELKQDVIIDDFEQLDKGVDFHLSYNPNYPTSKERLIDLMGLFLCKYGYFLYGKKYPNQLDIQFILSVEKQTYNHFHLIVLNMKPNDFKLFSGYFERFFECFYPNGDVYCKIIDNLKPFLEYDIKIPDTILLTNNDFKKGQ